jgi:hypothetical protein
MLQHQWILESEANKVNMGRWMREVWGWGKVKRKKRKVVVNETEGDLDGEGDGKPDEE